MRRLSAVLLLLFATACSSSSPGSGAACSSDDDCPDGECIAGACESADVQVDTPDEREIVETPDVEPELEVEEELDVPQPGSFGDPCEEDDDCASGYCVEADNGERVCTRFCDEDCPDGWECRLIRNTGGDAVRICVPVPDVLCAPCDRDGVCDLGGRCLEQANGMFCATPCSEGRLCPPAYDCAPVDRNADDGPVTEDLCVPISGACNPLGLSGPGVGGLGEVFRSTSFVMTGRFAPVTHRSTGGGFTLQGGF